MKLVSMLCDEDRKETSLRCLDKSLAQQNFAAECEINGIIKRFEKTGMLTHVSDKVAQFGDFTGIPDYQASLNFIGKANDLFMSLSAELRDRFNNDPASLLAFVSDPRNRAEGVKLGILDPEKALAVLPGDLPATPVKSDPSASGAQASK